jgi:hypothetical protein
MQDWIDHTEKSGLVEVTPDYSSQGLITLIPAA